MNNQLQDALPHDLLARLHGAQESLSPVLPLDEVMRLALAGALSIGAASGGAVWLRRAQIAPAARGEVAVFDARSGDVRAFDVRPLDDAGEQWLCVQTLDVPARDASNGAREYSQAKEAQATKVQPKENGALPAWTMTALATEPLSEVARRAAEAMEPQQNVANATAPPSYALPLLLGESVLGVIEVRDAATAPASASNRDFRDAAVRGDAATFRRAGRAGDDGGATFSAVAKRQARMGNDLRRLDRRHLHRAFGWLDFARQPFAGEFARR